MHCRSARRLFWGALLVCGDPLRTEAVHASVMEEITVEEMVATADLVVRGTVVRTGTRVVLEDGKLEPETHVWIEVAEPLAGEPPSRIVHLREPGGSYGETQVETSGVPHYAVGEEVIAFLTADATQPGIFRTHQMAQGKYRVVPAATAGSPREVVRDLEDVLFATWAERRFRLRPAPAHATRRMGDLLTSIRGFANARAKRIRKDGVR